MRIRENQSESERIKVNQSESERIRVNQKESEKIRVNQRESEGIKRASWGFDSLVKAPHDLLRASDCEFTLCPDDVTCVLLSSGNWKTSLGVGEVDVVGFGLLLVVLCWRSEGISSGEEGWDWEEGELVWYPLDGLSGLELEQAYKITPVPKHTHADTVLIKTNKLCFVLMMSRGPKFYGSMLT